MTSRIVGLVLSVILFVSNVTHANAAIVPADPSNYRNLIPTLQPGDTLELAAGDYPDGLPVTDLEGTATDPIVITGPETGAPVFPAASVSG